MFSSDQIDWGRIGWGALVPGLPLLLFGGGMGIAHYVFGMPIRQGHGNGVLASPSLILASTTAFVFIGALFVAMGVWLITAFRRRAGSGPRL